MTSAIGLGATLFFLVWGLNAKDMFFLMGVGVTAFLIGLGLIVNALLFTAPKQYVPARSLEVGKRDLIEAPPDRVRLARSELSTADQLTPPPSVT